MAPKHLGFAGRQVKLTSPDVDPHIHGAAHLLGISREPERVDVKLERFALIGHADIHVL